ncbi:hypothetical protein Agub_g8364 [Astrephomene gubernaculifera]|uniref:Uncharacterized protein n=1 Tax=Astrephomene gubernaculifera TaxID=47775 RepID=A0AAD3DVT7_9CHLO|nr:hypothetical protein Agub_g8364 [Astrephomene gubernaculifera]
MALHGMEYYSACVSEPQSETRRPLVVILPWMWAERSAIAKHVALYHSLGCDVAVFRGWPALAVWIPLLANRNASLLLNALAAHLRDSPRDVLLACYSGAAKGVLCPLLERLTAANTTGAAPPAQAAGSSPPAAPSQPAPHSAATTTLAPPPSSSGTPSSLPAQPHSRAAGEQTPHLPSQPQPQLSSSSASPCPLPREPQARLLRTHLRGIIFDSGPVDFDSAVGVRLFTTASVPWVRHLQAAASTAAAGLLDFCLYERFEAQRQRMWDVLRGGLLALRLPVLFLYSWRGDKLANPQPIHALARALRAATGAAAAAGQGSGQQGGGCSSDSVACSSSDSDDNCSGSAGGAAQVQAPSPVLVQEQAWDVSGHVAHLRLHPGDYRAAAGAFLGRCGGVGGGSGGP